MEFPGAFLTETWKGGFSDVRNHNGAHLLVVTYIEPADAPPFMGF